MFVVVEGGDGTGKSTLVAHLAQKFNIEPYATPPKKYRKYRTEVDKFASADDHYKFYKEAVLDASEEIVSLLAKQELVVCDRYWLSTATYHEVMGVSVDHLDFKSVVQPDLTVLLTTTPEEQIRRIVARGMSAGDKRMLDRQQEITQALFGNLVASNLRFISLDTGHFSPEECTAIVANIVQ